MHGYILTRPNIDINHYLSRSCACHAIMFMVLNVLFTSKQLRLCILLNYSLCHVADKQNGQSQNIFPRDILAMRLQTMFNRR